MRYTTPESRIAFQLRASLKREQKRLCCSCLLAGVHFRVEVDLILVEGEREFSEPACTLDNSNVSLTRSRLRWVHFLVGTKGTSSVARVEPFRCEALDISSYHPIAATLQKYCHSEKFVPKSKTLSTSSSAWKRSIEARRRMKYHEISANDPKGSQRDRQSRVVERVVKNRGQNFRRIFEPDCELAMAKKRETSSLKQE